MYDPKIWRSRGYLPHIDDKGLVQFITFRLADSVPKEVLESWHDEQRRGEISEATYRRRVETYLNQNYGSGALRDPRIARELQETLLKCGERYRWLAWTIMPNHAHILLECIGGPTVAKVMHSIKSYTAHAANRILDRKGRFWSKEYFDRYVRDRRHYISVVGYIEENPVKARLCRAPELWPFSSAFGREV